MPIRQIACEIYWICPVNSDRPLFSAFCLGPAGNGSGFKTWPTTQPWNSPAYIDWLEQRSMLKQSEQLAPLVSGKGAQWQHHYAEPQPRAAIQQASVWLLAYPGSVITRPGESVMASWGDPKLWEASRGYRHHSFAYRPREYHRGNRGARIHADG